MRGFAICVQGNDERGARVNSDEDCKEPAVGVSSEHTARAKHGTAQQDGNTTMGGQARSGRVPILGGKEGLVPPLSTPRNLLISRAALGLKQGEDVGSRVVKVRAAEGIIPQAAHVVEHVADLPLEGSGVRAGRAATVTVGLKRDVVGRIAGGITASTEAHDSAGSGEWGWRGVSWEGFACGEGART